MRTFSNGDPTINPFNEFLKNYGIWIAIGIAAIVFIIILIFFIISMKRKSNVTPKQQYTSVNKESFIDALGGTSNIVDHLLNGSRIVISLNDTSVVKESILKENGVKSIVKMSNKIILLVEGDSKEFYSQIFKSNEL